MGFELFGVSLLPHIGKQIHRHKEGGLLLPESGTANGIPGRVELFLEQGIDPP